MKIVCAVSLVLSLMHIRRVPNNRCENVPLKKNDVLGKGRRIKHGNMAPGRKKDERKPS